MYYSQDTLSTANPRSLAIVSGLRTIETTVQQYISNYYTTNPEGERVTLYVANHIGIGGLQNLAALLNKSLDGVKIALGMMVPIIADQMYPGQLETNRLATGKPISHKAPSGSAISTFTKHRLSGMS